MKNDRARRKTTNTIKRHFAGGDHLVVAQLLLVVPQPRLRQEWRGTELLQPHPQPPRARLQQLGFEEARCREALLKHGGDETKAEDWLLNN